MDQLIDDSVSDDPDVPAMRANLDPGERCDHEQKAAQMQRLTGGGRQIVGRLCPPLAYQIRMKSNNGLCKIMKFFNRRARNKKSPASNYRNPEEVESLSLTGVSSSAVAKAKNGVLQRL